MINDESLLSCQVSGRHRRVIERGGGEGSGEGGGKHLVPFRLSPTLPSQNETISDGKSCQESNGNIFRDTDSLMTNSSRSVASHPRIRGPVSLINDDEPRRSSLLLPAAPPRSFSRLDLSNARDKIKFDDRSGLDLDRQESRIAAARPQNESSRRRGVSYSRGCGYSAARKDPGAAAFPCGRTTPIAETSTLSNRSRL